MIDPFLPIEEFTYHSSSSLMNEENFANDIRAYRLGTSASNAHEQAGGKQAIKTLRETTPHGAEAKDQETNEDNRSSSENIR
jgi:hypothetical protein